jgi:hypothetical protein
MSEFPAEAGPARAGLRATRLGFRHTGLGIGVGASKPPLNPNIPPSPSPSPRRSSTRLMCGSTHRDGRFICRFDECGQDAQMSPGRKTRPPPNRPKRKT